MKNNLGNAALILIDIQNGFDDIDYWGTERNNPQAEQNCRKLLDLWRASKLPVYHIQHTSVNPRSRLAPGQYGHEHKEIVRPLPDEPVIEKSANSAFIGTDLKQLIDSAGINTLILTGFVTDHCVSSTARMAGNYGYRTIVISDATATFDRIGVDGIRYSAELMHATALASLNQEFADIINTEEIIART